MATGKRVFRTEASYAFERQARGAVVPFLLSRGFVVDNAQRPWTTPGQPQVVQVRSPGGEDMRIRVRLCWRRDGRREAESLYSAAQLAANTREGGWNATLEYLEGRDRAKGITHTLFFQRDGHAEVHAALVPSSAVAQIWRRQYEVSDTLIREGRLGNLRKNHAANGDSPTIWLQDDREPDAHHVADVLWQWPGVVDVVAMPVVRVATRPKYWRVLDAVIALGGSATAAEVRDWLESHMPAADYSDTRENLTHLTVNDANRRHYDRSRASFRSDQEHPRDVLVRSGSGADARYERYEPERHGVYDIVIGEDGRHTAVQVVSGSVANALARAEAFVDADGFQAPLPIGDDARERELRAVVLRRGQPGFRAKLLQAYRHRCAVTGCAVVDVLEAAHIVPYRGDHTQRVDNGLLLRTDIHTLFDLGRLWIDAEMKVRVCPSLLQTDYASLDGVSLALPEKPEDRPHPDHLESHRNETAGIDGTYNASYSTSDEVLDRLEERLARARMGHQRNTRRSG